MLSIEEYGKKLNALCEKYLESSDESVLQKIYDTQSEYMGNVLKEYENTIGNSKEKLVIYSLLEYAYNKSVSGSVILNLSDFNFSKEEEKEVFDKLSDGMIFEEIGDYLLDECCYEEDDEYVVDVMFGGYYVPMWDGFTDGTIAA